MSISSDIIPSTDDVISNTVTLRYVMFSLQKFNGWNGALSSKVLPVGTRRLKIKTLLLGLISPLRFIHIF